MREAMKDYVGHNRESAADDRVLARRALMKGAARLTRQHTQKSSKPTGVGTFKKESE